MTLVASSDKKTTKNDLFFITSTGYQYKGTACSITHTVRCLCSGFWKYSEVIWHMTLSFQVFSDTVALKQSKNSQSTKIPMNKNSIRHQKLKYDLQYSCLPFNFQVLDQKFHTLNFLWAVTTVLCLILE